MKTLPVLHVVEAPPRGGAADVTIDANPGKLVILPWMMSGGGGFPSGSFLTLWPQPKLFLEVHAI